MQEYINEIVFTRDDCGDELWDCVAQQLKLLCKAQQIATIYDDDNDIIVIKYSHSRAEYGSPLPEWLTPEEREEIYSYRASKEEKGI